MSQVKTIDYLDLKLPVGENQHAAVEDAVKKFEDEFDHVVKTPRLKPRELRINSMDFVHFLGYLDTSSWLPIDRRRWKKSVRTELEQLLMKSLNADYQYHYKWCLSAITNLPEGRYLPATGSS